MRTHTYAALSALVGAGMAAAAGLGLSALAPDPCDPHGAMFNPCADLDVAQIVDVRALTPKGALFCPDGYHAQWADATSQTTVLTCADVESAAADAADEGKEADEP